MTESSPLSMDSSDDDVFGLCGGYTSLRPPIQRAASLQQPAYHSPPLSAVRCLSSPVRFGRLLRQGNIRGDEVTVISRGRCITSNPNSRSSSSSPVGKSCNRHHVASKSSSPIPISPLTSTPPGRSLSSNSKEDFDSSSSDKSTRFEKDFVPSSPRPMPAFLRFGKANLQDSMFAAPSRSESLQELFSTSPASSRKNIFTDVFHWGKSRWVNHIGSFS